ncbi:hypothetical protein [Falsirhodobacter sp. 1013]
MAKYPEQRDDEDRRPDPVGNVITPITPEIIPQEPDEVMPEKEPDEPKGA